MVKQEEEEENSYEAARKKRVLENLKQLENLGISKISKSLQDVPKSEHKQLKSKSRERSTKKFQASELRRSSRAKNPVSYRDQVDEIELRSHRKRYCSSNDNGREYTGRYSSYEEQAKAFEKAQDIQSSLDNPSFVKAMVRSHVSSCFWLGLPSRFCKDHLPAGEARMVLEDEKGAEFDAVYIGSRTGLSGGWRGFAMDHELEDGDALVFELIAPDHFKIYIVKALEDPVGDENHKDTALNSNKAILLAKHEEEEEKEEEHENNNTPETTRYPIRSRKQGKIQSENKTPETTRYPIRSRKQGKIQS